MDQEKQLAHLLVGDHLGQVKKILLPSFEVKVLPGLASPSSSNPVVSIEPIISNKSKRLIANRSGELYIYNAIQDTTKRSKVKGSDCLNKALSIQDKKVLFVHDKQVSIGHHEIVKQKKKGEIKNAQVKEDTLAFGGLDIPLTIYNIEKKMKVFDSEPPEKDWLGIQPDTYVSGIDFVAQTRVATCSKTDSVVRIYDLQSNKRKPVISVDINKTAFNEYADSAKFLSITSTGDTGHTVLVGSNVGQILAIDLRFNIKQLPKKKRLRPNNYKIIGGFKGARGATIKDVKVVPGYSIPKFVGNAGDDHSEAEDVEEREDCDLDQVVNTAGKQEYKVISCCLDRYLRIHDFTRTSRNLFKHVYMNTKPICCSPVFYRES